MAMDRQRYVPSKSFLQVSINSYTTETDSEGKYTSFRISLQTPFAAWEVSRRYRQFLALHQELTQRMPAIKFPTFPRKKVLGSSLQPSFVEDRKCSLEAYLRSMLQIPDMWTCACFIQFFDDSHSLLEMQLQMARFSDRVSVLERNNDVLQAQLHTTTHSLQQAISLINDLHRRVTNIEMGPGHRALAADGNRNGVFSDPAKSASTNFGDEIVRNFRNLSSEWRDRDQNWIDTVFIEQSSMTTNSNRRNSASLLSGETQTHTFDLRVLEQRSASPNTDPIFDLSNVSSTFPGTIQPTKSQSSLHDANWFADGMPSTSPEQTPGYFVQQILSLDQSKMHNALHGGGASHNFTNETFGSPKDDSNSGIVDQQSGWHNLALSLGLPMNLSAPLMSTIRPEFGQPTATIWDELVDEVVMMVQPQEAQITYRSSVTNFLTKHVRKTLNVHVFEVGVQGLRAFLPDDPVRLSIFTGRIDKESSWYVKLNERLCRLSGGMHEEPDSSNTDDFLHHFSQVQLNDLGDATSQQDPPAVHNLTNVSFLSDSDGIQSHKLQCLVDSVLGVEIVANSRNDLCFLAFFEELDGLVGKNHLFKRSATLIRAWWVYEANLASVLPDFAVCILLAAIFNRHHESLHHPLQVLFCFLSEYANVNFASSVLTLFGAVSYDHYSDGDHMSFNYQTISPATSSVNLLTSGFLNKHRCLFQAVDPEPTDAGILTIIPSETDGRLDLQVSSPPLPISPTMKTPRNVGICFQSRPLMIAHPFAALKTNMVPENSSASFAERRATAISEALKKGIVTLRGILEEESAFNEAKKRESGALFNYHGSVEKLFKTVMIRFGRGWRPDAPMSAISEMIVTTPPVSSRFDDGPGHWLSGDNNASFSIAGSTTFTSTDGHHVDSGSVMATSGHSNQDLSRILSEGGSAAKKSSQGALLSFVGDVWTLNLPLLMDRIRYANLLIEAQISESALRTLSVEILAEKGSLPVGEIGKMLQEATAMNNMSAALKEKFGGLKKFLEKYPEDFVLSTDHPFNPHVYLRLMLNTEDLAAVMRGEVPAIIKLANLAMKNKKSKSSGSRNAVSTNSGSANSINAYNNSGGRRNRPLSHHLSSPDVLIFAGAEGGHNNNAHRIPYGSNSGMNLTGNAGGGMQMGRAMSAASTSSVVPQDFYGAFTRRRFSSGTVPTMESIGEFRGLQTQAAPVQQQQHHHHQQYLQTQQQQQQQQQQYPALAAGTSSRQQTAPSSSAAHAAAEHAAVTSYVQAVRRKSQSPSHHVGFMPGMINHNNNSSNNSSTGGMTGSQQGSLFQANNFGNNSNMSF